ncbi:hypothetical protein OF83DRAFT_1179829 [Amylostereum chailletii]|nr:hypothetical protein OF83DRAFT_1179829 [Amylostereum chailletii]
MDSHPGASSSPAPAQSSAYAQPFPVPYTRWLKLSARWCLVACNTKYMPTYRLPQPLGSIFARTDGCLGIHEWSQEPQEYDKTVPWLAYMHVPRPAMNNFLLDSVDRSMWELQQDSGDERILKPTLRPVFRTTLDQAKVRAAIVFPQARQDLALLQVILPQLALNRATDAYGKLITGVDSWADFVLALRGL